eukprot:1108-Heterococcus_DN1.PRE.1
MVRNLKLVGGSDDEDSDLEGEEVELQVGEDGKLIVPVVFFAALACTLHAHKDAFAQLDLHAQCRLHDDNCSDDSDDSGNDSDLEYAPALSKRKRNKDEDSDEDAPLRRVTKRPGDAAAASAARAKAKQAKVRLSIDAYVVFAKTLALS